VRLGDFLDAHRRRPFVWGSHDCCTFVCAAVQLRSGVDLMDGWPAYSSEREAAETLRAAGDGTLIKTFRARMTEIPVAHARPWDVVALDVKRLGVCAGRLSAFVGEEGLEFRETLSCLTAFRAEAAATD